VPKLPEGHQAAIRQARESKLEAKPATPAQTANLAKILNFRPKSTPEQP
jgi:hypothetical protein